MANLTTANSIILLSFAGLFPVAQQLQGYAAEDILDTADMENKETVMGIDGRLSAGWVPVPTVQTFTLQADSPSLAILDAVIDAEQVTKSAIQVQGTIVLPGLGASYQMNNGWLTSFTPISAAKKIAQPRKFVFKWESFSRNSI